ncbi:APC family permease [Corynebacterium sp. HMSC28B08]|uniref:APC family permease n=1 Tax=Corynebacterium sp. HMSC28B08 TaxID=1581066 RepID=UPI0008A1B671|nr:amino acid permease [Corynebacterium sp. HMSC28B08]OFT87603.1 amino acid permease [Corynebacterium sp. HMSC28B08]
MSSPTNSGLFRTKTVEQSISETQEEGFRLKRELRTLDLIVFGVSVVIGAGIFTMTAQVAGDMAGPSVAIAFVLAAVTCGLAAFCYAEFASTVPVAGSAYTFSFATFGELIAWIIGWDLVLEFFVAAAVVAKAWSSYAGGLMGSEDFTLLKVGGLTIDWGAALLVLVLGALLARGTKLSSRVSAVITAIKLGVVLFVIVVGAFHIKAENYRPFIPPAQQNVSGSGEGLKQTLFSWATGADGSAYGLFGIFAAASLVFFAFVGFDVVASAAEETRNPQKAMPRGILITLVIVTVLYVAVALVLTGMVKYTELSTPEDGHSRTLATAFAANGIEWAGTIINVGAIAGLTTVVMVMMLGQTRVAFAMSRDGLLPRSLAKTSKHGTPSRITWITTIAIALLAAVAPAGDLGEMVNIGTLFAFLLVALGTPVLRKRYPGAASFKTPMVPFLPILSAIFTLWLMANLSIETWIRFLVWMALGFAVYFLYSRKHSVLAQAEGGE